MQRLYKNRYKQHKSKNNPNKSDIPWIDFKINIAFRPRVPPGGITEMQVRILSPFAPETGKIVSEK